MTQWNFRRHSPYHIHRKANAMSIIQSFFLQSTKGLQKVGVQEGSMISKIFNKLPILIISLARSRSRRNSDDGAWLVPLLLVSLEMLFQDIIYLHSECAGRQLPLRVISVSVSVSLLLNVSSGDRQHLPRMMRQSGFGFFNTHFLPCICH